MKEPCRACGCPIEKILGPNGKFIPVQKVRTVYSYVNGWDSMKKALASSKEEPFDYYVSHFETCSDPGRFSKRGKG